MQDNISILTNPWVASRVTGMKYIGPTVPDIKLKCITKVIFQKDKKKN